MIALALLRRDGGTQPRASINHDAVAEYEAAMRDGAEFPPVVVFHDGTDHWLADGFHRVAAAERAGVGAIAADVRQGTRRDAVLFSVGANAAHGLRRTNEDKQRAVRTLLDDAEWAAWSDREIARRCGVSHTTVVRMRPAPAPPPLSGTVFQIAPDPEPPSGKVPQIPAASVIGGQTAPTRTVERGGKVFQQRTGTINAGRAETRAKAHEAAAAGVTRHLERAAVQGVTPTVAGTIAAGMESVAAALPPRPPAPFALTPPPPPPAEIEPVGNEWVDWTGAVKDVAELDVNFAALAKKMPVLNAKLLGRAQAALARLPQWIEALERVRVEAA